MAKVKGIVTLNGTIGGVTFYQLNGKQVSRAAGGGFNGDAIRTKASMQRVRENGSEFGHCSKANKLFRLATREFYEHYKFAGLHGYLMRLFTQLKDLDSVSGRGQRQVEIGVQTDAGKVLLKTFNYTPQSQLATLFPYTPVFDVTNYRLRYTNVDVSNIKFPKGATHLKLMYGVLDMDFTHMTYQRYAAEPVWVDRSFGGGAFEIAVTDMPVIQHTGIAVLGMRLYQNVDGVLYALNDERFVGLKVFSL